MAVADDLQKLAALDVCYLAAPWVTTPAVMYLQEDCANRSRAIGYLPRLWVRAEWLASILGLKPRTGLPRKVLQPDYKSTSITQSLFLAAALPGPRSFLSS